MNSDEAKFQAARDLLLAHLEGRFANVASLAGSADSDVIMALLAFASTAWSEIGGGDSGGAIALRAVYEGMRQAGGLEFPDPFDGL